MPPKFYESDGNDSFPDDEKYRNQSPYFSTMSKTTINSPTDFNAGSHRSSLPADTKYFQRSSLKSSKKYNKKDTRPRPKPLQMENEKYYDHIFPVSTKSTNKYSYQPDSSNHAEL